VSRRILLTTDVVGGVWDFCITLAGGLRSAGDDVVLLALGSPTHAQRHAADSAGAQLVSLPLKLEWMTDSAIDVALTRNLVGQVARQVGADIVHANQFAAACADVDVPVVLTLHSDVLSWRRSTLGATDVPPEWQSYTALVREALARADHVVSVSRFLADEVMDLYRVPRNIEVVHNGWPTPAEISPLRTRATVAAGRIWDAAKNISLIAEAATGWQPGPVFLAGETSHPDGGTVTAPSQLTQVGFLNQQELGSLLDESRVYVSAAKYDPFGLLPLQAALHGCSLVLSDIPSYREVWGDTATYFRSGDAHDLREKWQAVLEGPTDRRALTRASRDLTVARMLDRYLDLYTAERRAIAA
jgi:glycogen synthase